MCGYGILCRMGQTEFTIRRKVFTILGGAFHIYASDGRLLGYCRQKAFRLKEDIRFFTDESRTQELLRIAARSIIDFGATYDVSDSRSDARLGAYRRKGLKSILRDEWRLLDENDAEMGVLTEDSAGTAFVRRFLPLGNLIPQRFSMTINGERVAEFRTHFNPFIHRLTATVFAGCPVNPLFVVAGGVLLIAIEGRQQQ